MNITRIGIVVAMDKELQPFLSNKHYTKTTINGYEVYSFEMCNKQVVCCKLRTVGEICAAGATQLLITQYQVQLILNFGVVGALTDNGKLLDTMLVGSVVHYDMDTSCVDNCKVGRYLIFDDVAIPTDQDMLQLALSVQNLPVVRCASADKFVEGEQAKSALNKQFGADICDMESAGIVITCKLNGVKVLLIKTVSDALTGGVQEFEVNLQKAAQQYVHFVEQLLQKIN